MTIELKLQNPDLSVGQEFAIARALSRKRRQIVAGCRARYRAKSEALGRCPRCPRKPEPGNRFCATCIASQVEKKRRRMKR